MTVMLAIGLSILLLIVLTGGCIAAYLICFFLSIGDWE